jgi:SAM-dependent methyltransferase
MAAQRNRKESSGNFEFDALRWANNYRKALLHEFEPHLLGNVIEVGAGIGQFTELLVGLSSIKSVLAIEPEERFCAELRDRLPNQELKQGTVEDLDPGTSCDAVVSTNVLEHIENDTAELRAYAELLRDRRGHLCLFVPARSELYAPIDKDFGHFRRYSKSDLKSKLGGAGFVTKRLDYFNCAGYFAWLLTFRVLSRRAFSPAGVRFFDRFIFLPTHWVESQVMRPPFGQSLLAVAQASA